MLALDHLSIVAPNHAEARAALERVFGRAPVITPADFPHARLFLHRSYLELREGPGPRWEAPLYFLRYEDTPRTARALGERGVRFAGPSPYQGLDGVWEELLPEAGPTVPAPLLVRRVDDAVAVWPPALERPGEEGNVVLGAVLLECAEPQVAISYLERLVGAEAAEVDRGIRGRWFELPLDARARVCVRAQPAARTGVVGFEVACPSLRAVEAQLRSEAVAYAPEGKRELWLDPAVLPGLSVGFVER